uniref:Thyroglobulin type-1 domain-containing protein n=1 Tax=Steinernema glaseri TaxID=37863 RepID=A0A1I7YE06_9BILA
MYKLCQRLLILLLLVSAVLCCTPMAPTKDNETPIVEKPNVAKPEEQRKCPDGEVFQKTEGGVDYCWPEGESLQKVENGKAICCKQGTVLKGVFNGAAKCCKMDYNYDAGSGICCGKGFFYRANGNDWRCCNKEYNILARAPNGKTVCCNDVQPKAVNHEDGYAGCCQTLYNKLILVAGNYQCSI